MKTVAPRLFPSTLPLTDRTPGTRTDAQAARTLLTENAGARRVTFHLNSNASVDLMLSPPPVTQLILSVTAEVSWMANSSASARPSRI